MTTIRSSFLTGSPFDRVPDRLYALRLPTLGEPAAGEGLVDQLQAGLSLRVPVIRLLHRCRRAGAKAPKRQLATHCPARRTQRRLRQGQPERTLGHINQPAGPRPVSQLLAPDLQRPTEASSWLVCPKTNGRKSCLMVITIPRGAGISTLVWRRKKRYIVISLA